MKTISPATLKSWIGDGAELAILDAREDGEFGRSHLFWAVPCPLSRAELRVRSILPRRGVRICCVDGGEGRLAERLAAYLEGIAPSLYVRNLHIAGCSLEMHAAHLAAGDPAYVWEEHARAITPERMRADLLLMKQGNVNFVRTSHYAPDPLIERHFGRYPSLATPSARALGFVDDGALGELARRATEADR